jgi:hypothetical protein
MIDVDDGHCGCSASNVRNRAVNIVTIDVSFAEMETTTSLDHPSHGAKRSAKPLRKVGDLDLGSYGVLMGCNKREGGKSSRNVSNRCGYTAMHKPQLLLVDRVKWYLGYHMARLDGRQHAADVMHEPLTLKVTYNGCSKIWIADSK